MKDKEKRMVMTWPELNVSVEIVPNEDGTNKWIYDWYVEHCPFSYLQVHSMLTGHTFYSWTQAPATLPVQSNNKLSTFMIRDWKIGDVHLSYNRPNSLAGGSIAHISVCYGTNYEDMSAYIAGRVVEADRNKLVEVGNAIAESIYRTKKPIRCVVSAKES